MLFWIPWDLLVSRETFLSSTSSFSVSCPWFWFNYGRCHHSLCVFSACVTGCWSLLTCNSLFLSFCLAHFFCLIWLPVKCLCHFQSVDQTSTEDCPPHYTRIQMQPTTCLPSVFILSTETTWEFPLTLLKLFELTPTAKPLSSPIDLFEKRREFTLNCLPSTRHGMELSSLALRPLTLLHTEVDQTYQTTPVLTWLTSQVLGLNLSLNALQMLIPFFPFTTQMMELFIMLSMERIRATSNREFQELTFGL